jgi:hypothetical protein
MTIETEVALLTTAVTTQTGQVAVAIADVGTAVAGFAATTARVDALPLVDNTSDAGKPISTATQTALDAKQVTLNNTNLKTVNGDSLLGTGNVVAPRGPTSLTKVEYDNRASLRALSPAEDDSALVKGLGLFMWVASTDEPDDDETCFTTAGGQWLLECPAWDLVDALARPERAVRDAWDEDENERFEIYLIETGR